jgi:MFS family permease
LAFTGPAGAAIFAILYGAGNGLLTIARGTVPLAVFGPGGYGERTGLLAAPARAVQALAPLLFGLLLDRMGASVILVSVGLCLSALGALLCLQVTQTSQRVVWKQNGRKTQ